MNFDEIKKSLDLIMDPVDKLEFVMDLGKTLTDVPKYAICTEILGCSSFVQICRKGNNFYGVADSMMVRGIVAIILSMVDGKTPEQIKQIDLLKNFNDLNLNFGASRLNGIQSMINFFDNL